MIWLDGLIVLLLAAAAYLVVREFVRIFLDP